MLGLTQKQQKVLNFVEDFINNNQYAPSIREIQKHFKFSSVTTAHKHVNVLKRKGYLSSEAGCSRSLTIEEKQLPFENEREVELPFFGTLSKEFGIETFPEIQTLSVPKRLVPSIDNVIILRVKGEGLEDVLITDGDLVIVETKSEAEEGELALGRLDSDEFFVGKGETEDLKIFGVILSLIRLYH